MAVIDALIQQCVPVHIAALIERLQAGDPRMAIFVGLPLDLATGLPAGPVDQATRDLVAPLVEHAALTMVLNEAWLLLGSLALLSLTIMPLLRQQQRVAASGRHETTP